MKGPLLVAVLLSSTVTGAQPLQRGKAIFFAPDAERVVTFRQGALLLSSTVVPRGSLLAVEYEADRELVPDTTGRFEAHGRVVVRITAGHSDQAAPLEARMRRAPVVLTGEGVDVVVTRR